MNLRDLSIKRKLTLMAMLTSSLALLLSSAGFLIYDLVSFRKLLSKDLTTQSEIVAYNSAAAMAFKDDASAKVTLSALTAKDDIVAAVLYTTDGRGFARYFRSNNPAPVLPEHLQQNGYRFAGNYIEGFSDVTFSGESLRKLFLPTHI